jgi:hypothetical protein
MKAKVAVPREIVVHVQEAFTDREIGMLLSAWHLLESAVEWIPLEFTSDPDEFNAGQRAMGQVRCKLDAANAQARKEEYA